MRGRVGGHVICNHDNVVSEEVQKSTSPRKTPFPSYSAIAPLCSVGVTTESYILPILLHNTDCFVSTLQNKG